MSPSFEFDAPEHFTIGAVGKPGERVFYVQAREADRLVTLKTEKEQVSALAEYLAGLLAKLPGPPEADAEASGELLEPLTSAWDVGSLGVGYDEERQRVVVVAGEEVEEGHEEEAAEARFRITPQQAAAFVERARALVRAGRPICPVCSQAKDPAGHVCPRSNGHVAGRSV